MSTDTITTAQDRDEIAAWFADQPGDADGWVPVANFIAAWEGLVTPGQGRTDLAALVRKGRLQKRVDYGTQSGPRGIGTAYYRVPR